MSRAILLAGLAASFIATLGLALTASGPAGHVADTLLVFLGFLAIYAIVEGAT